MSIHVANAWFFASSIFLISVLILLKRRDETGRRWFYFSIFSSFWAIHYAFLVNNDVNNDIALYITRFGHASAAFIPATWVYFVCSFLGIRRRAIFWIAWPLAWILAVLSFTSFFIPSVSPVREFLHYTDPGKFYILHPLSFCLILSYSLYLMAQCYFKEESKDRRNEIFSLFFAVVIGFTGGGSTYTLALAREKGVDLSFLLSGYPFLMAYAMTKHRALDIEKIAEAFQKEKLAAIGILSAGINHELKSPLFIARERSALVLRYLKKEKDEKQESFESAVKNIEVAIKQIDRATEMMRKLSDFSKPSEENGNFEKILLVQVFDNVLELIRYQFSLDKILISQDIAQDIHVLGNRRQLEEIFFNLILNASQVMKGKGGEISIRARKIEKKSRQMTEVLIQDTGLGMASADQTQIFEPFYSTKGKEGTGLGLYITKQLVERNGGKIWFESLPKGASFFIEFKAAS